MAQNAFDYWSQSALSQHATDIMLIYSTRGAPIALGYAANVYDAAIDDIADSIVETGDYDLFNSIGIGLQKGTPDGDQLVVDSISKSLGDNSGSALTFLWKLFTDKEKGILMNRVREKQAEKSP